jgi:fucose 4-O-acetylase-like acetyltransferase
LKIWTRAAELAASTPPSRNRYVDFLRAVSILVVIFGHWTAAAPYVNADGGITPTHILAEASWTRWLTWLIQVMPIFFLVGGYSNGISWQAAQRDQQPYALWLESRLRRLVGPVLTLIVTWCAIGALAHLRGVSPAMIRIGSQMALIPIWFLAVYLGVVVLVPVTHSLWQRFGMRSYFALVAIAIAIDACFFAGVHWIGWTNYLFVWSAVHQLGYAWRDGHFSNWKRTLPWAIVGVIALVALTVYGPYPVSMVGVPGEAISNTTPPKITLLALGALQLGLLLSLEAPLRRWLARARPWTATVLINGMIMTIYLWHLTAMVLVIALSSVLGGIGLKLMPGTREWWMTRPVWHAVLVVALVPLALVFSRFERPGKARGDLPAAWRLVVGALTVSFGMAFLALGGVAGEGWLGLNLWVIAMPIAGAALMRRWTGRARSA